MKVLQGEKQIAKIWTDSLDNVETSAKEMIVHMLGYPDLSGHIAIMPDTHLGVGAVIGGVVATNETIVPNIVGVDIGCGMSAFNTGIKITDIENTKEFWKVWGGKVKREVPMGFNSHKEKQLWKRLEEPIALEDDDLNHLLHKGIYQLGTLGGGNHFMETQVDEQGNVWFMVHSGSRNMGLQFANKYNRMAQELNQKHFSNTPKDLWFLPMDSKSGEQYVNAMNFAIEFALENRWRMLEQMVNAFEKDLTLSVRQNGINIHHNFAALESHNGKNIIVHRKGATFARSNVTGIIPGSMGTSSYIVIGTDNEDSYTSCSHGAGRKMSRKAAHATITEKMFVDSLAKTFTPASANYLDEAPDAYKDIEDVMRNQSDLVKIEHTLRPIFTLKSDDNIS